MPTLLRNLISIPEHVAKGDFVLKLTEGTDPAKVKATLDKIPGVRLKIPGVRLSVRKNTPSLDLQRMRSFELSSCAVATNESFEQSS